MRERPMTDLPLPHLTGVKDYRRRRAVEANLTFVLIVSVISIAFGLIFFWLANNGWFGPRVGIVIGCFFLASGICGVVASGFIKKENAA